MVPIGAQLIMCLNTGDKGQDIILMGWLLVHSSYPCL